MGLELYITPIKTTIGSLKDYDTETIYREKLETIESLIEIIQQKIKEQTGKVEVWDEEQLSPHDEELVKQDDMEDFCERIGNHSMIHHLRRYAAHIDVVGKPPEYSCELEEASNDEFLLDIYDEKTKTNFPHLINHSDCDGYYIPCDFPEPIWIEPEEYESLEKHIDEPISVGSSLRLMDELNKINTYLKINPDDIEDLEKFYETISNDNLEFVKWCWAVLHTMCQKSINHRQPIVFC